MEVKRRASYIRDWAPSVLKTGDVTTIQDFIKDDVANEFICLKLDGCKRFDREFIGINVQFRKTLYYFRLYTLGCYEIKEKRTSQNLVKYILEIVKKWDFS